MSLESNIAKISDISGISEHKDVHRYRLHTYSSYNKLNLEQCKDLFIGNRAERYGRDCLILNRYEDEKIFVFKFGTAVFFNVPVSEHEHYLSKLGITPRANAKINTSEEDIAEDDFILNIDPKTTKVAFNAVTLSEFDLTKLQLVAQVLAQSSALELIEWEVEEFLAESEKMTNEFKKPAFFGGRRDKLLKFLGEALSARHRIVNQLSLLTKPEKTWDKEDLYQLHSSLFECFDITDRIQKTEKMLGLSGHVSELLLDVVNSRRVEVLEIVIILLIGLEIVNSLL